MEHIRAEGNANRFEKNLQGRAQDSANTIINSPLLLPAFSLEMGNRPAGPLDGISSSLLFVSPGRERFPDGTVEVVHDSSIPIIPTKHLFDIFTRQLQLCLIDPQSSFEICRTFSSHPHLRSSAGWLEALVLARLGSDADPPLDTFQGEPRSTMQPSTRVVPGTLDGLGGAAKIMDAAF